MTAGPDDLALLTGDDVRDLLETALGTDGGRLVSWQARSVDARPGGGSTVSYRAQAVFGDGERTVWLGASTRPLPAGAEQSSDALVLTDGAQTVVVWSWPRDPWLPALPVACDPVRVGALLESFGAAPAPVRLHVRAYRPGRRAVLQARSDSGRVYVKVVRPQRVEALHERHRLLAGAGLPVPRSLGWDARGLVALQELSGEPMRDRLRARGSVPRPEQLLGLLDALPAAVLDLPRRPSWTDAAQHYASVVSTALTGAGLPEQADRARRFADDVVARLQSCDATPEPTHGDLYEGQLLLDDDGAVSALLDVDTAGPGRHADDLACLLAHLEVLAGMEPAHAASTRAVLAAWQAVFEQGVDPVELRLRTAGVLLSLATGPHRVQDDGWPRATAARLDLVQHWLDGAGRAARPAAAVI